jgi:LicD family
MFLSNTSLQSLPKYFQEHPLAGHLDLRFAPADLSLSPAHHLNRTALHNLLHTYVFKMRDLDTSIWLANGTLLGWCWGKQFVPWDHDLDMHIWLD